jgi:long-chain fatty acid transport protein
MGGAAMANEAEPASLAVNPALITELEGTQAQLGLTAVTADATTSVAGQTRSLKNDVWYLPNFFITQKWSDQVSFGLGGFSRYGLGGEYQDPVTSWIGSNLAYKVKLETFSFTPTIAVKASDEFSVAMGLEAMLISFAQNSYFNLDPSNSGNYEISGSGVSWGGNFSFIYKPEWAEKWALGGMYRTKVKQNLNGRINADGKSFPQINIHGADAEGSISLPDSISAGIAFRPTDAWTLEAGIVGTFWSSYDQILIQYTDSESSPVIRNKKKYKDVYRLNFGTDYKLNQNWALRAGFVYENPRLTNTKGHARPVDDGTSPSIAQLQNRLHGHRLCLSLFFSRGFKAARNSCKICGLYTDEKRYVC